MNEVFIASAKRTPIGGFLGSLSGFSAPELGAIAIREACTSIELDRSNICSVYMGNVLSANLGQSPARQAALLAGISNTTDCTTINKVCAAGMKATMLGAQQIQLGLEDIVITGGMESMSNAPHYAFLRKTTKLGNEQLTDGLQKDGLIDAFHQVHMGVLAERTVSEFQLTRAQQDQYALESYAKAERATAQGKFKMEIAPVQLITKSGPKHFVQDDDIYKIIPEKVPGLKPSFMTDGTITAANASNLNDGAAALVLVSKKAMLANNLKPRAKIIAYADAAVAPENYGKAPAKAIEKALEHAKLKLNQIDFIELNEAYAAVALANQKILGFDFSKTNLYGGAVAMGHPLGASGARILCTLLSVLQQEGGTYGLAAICNGGGGASAMIIQNLTHH